MQSDIQRRLGVVRARMGASHVEESEPMVKRKTRGGLETGICPKCNKRGRISSKPKIFTAKDNPKVTYHYQQYYHGYGEKMHTHNILLHINDLRTDAEKAAAKKRYEEGRQRGWDTLQSRRAAKNSELETQQKSKPVAKPQVKYNVWVQCPMCTEFGKKGEQFIQDLNGTMVKLSIVMHDTPEGMRICSRVLERVPAIQVKQS